MTDTRLCKGKYQVSGKPGCFEEFEVGRFHQWGSNFVEFESGAGNYSVAIVELPDGKIVMPMADDICFLEDEAISKLIEKCINKKESPYTPEGAKNILNLYRDHVCIMMLQQKEAEKTETLYSLFNALKMGEYALTQLMEQRGKKEE